MKRPRFAVPDEFSLSPLLALLPWRGDLARLESLTSSFYARFEKVEKLLAESDEESELRRRHSAEHAMLKQVLDWLSDGQSQQGAS